MAVGTRVGSAEDDKALEEEKPLGRWGGRLLLFVLTSPGRTMQVHVPRQAHWLVPQHVRVACIRDRATFQVWAQPQILFEILCPVAECVLHKCTQACLG